MFSYLLFSGRLIDFPLPTHASISLTCLPTRSEFGTNSHLKMGLKALTHSHLMLIFSLQTYDKLRTYLLKAIQECSEGFGFA